MKTIDVVSAVIISKNDLGETVVFATARGYGDYKGKWEFPGGKIEEGESPQQALIREIHEELDVLVMVGESIDIIEYDYPEFHLSMECFWCRIEEGYPKLIEAEESRWLTAGELNGVDWLPADKFIINKIRENLVKNLS